MTGTVRALSLSNYRVLFQLDKFSRQSKMHAHGAYLLAGFILLVIPKKPSTSRKSRTTPSWGTLLFAALFGAVMLMLSSAILGEVQPLLYQAGKLSLVQGLSVLMVLFSYLRYREGAKYLKLFGKNHNVLYPHPVEVLA